MVDWTQFVEWGLAATIALGAKREMTKFRKMFESTLKKMNDRIDRIEYVMVMMQQGEEIEEEAVPEGIGFRVRDEEDDEEEE